MAVINLRDVHKSYGRSEVIHGVSCDIGDGEFIVVVGPSGCGKSTLLRMIAGLESVSSGEIAIGDIVVNDIEPAERDIAMVFQNYALYPHMTVFNNMAYGLKNRGVSKTEIAAKVQKAAEILELQALLQRRPRELSGGQRQRVAMGRAIVREPKAFLFDEPLSNLDAKLRVQMRIEIKRLHDELGITSVYVTHDQVEAMTLGQRLLVMNGGHVEQIGAPLELYETPRTAFVASFIGSPSMNLLSGRVDDNGRVVQLSGGVSLQTADSISLPPGAELSVGIRPEHCQIIDGKGDNSNLLRLRADLVEALGADTLVHGRLQDDNATSEALTLRTAGTLNIRAGESLTLRVEPRHIHLFDATSGARIN